MFEFLRRQPRWVLVSTVAVAAAVVLATTIIGAVVTGWPRYAVVGGGMLFAVVSVLVTTAQSDQSEAAKQFQIEVCTEPLETVVPSAAGPGDTINHWLVDERAELMAPLAPKPEVAPVRIKRTASPSTEKTAGGLAIPPQAERAWAEMLARDAERERERQAMFDRVAITLDGSRPEDRTTEAYEAEVDRYIERCRQVMVRYFGGQYVKLGVGVFQLFAFNPSHLPWHDVRVELFLAGPVAAIDPRRPVPTELPKRPRLFGERRPPKVPFVTLPSPPAAARYAGPQVDQTPEGVSIAFQPFELRPEAQAVPLDEIRLLVVGGPGTVIDGTWEATATNGHTRKRGTLRIVAGDTLDVAPLLANMAGDLGC